MTSGLVRRPHYEEVLAAAIKDKESKHGILSVPMQRFATEAINNPLFQRVQATLEGSLEAQEKKVIEAKVFEQNLTRAAMDAKIPKADYKWATENLNPPPPPAVPQPPPEAKIDYDRIAAEMDLVMQRRAVKASHQNLADQEGQRLARQAVATPAQQLIRNHHIQSLSQPVPNRPAPGQTMTDDAKRRGISVHERFLQQSSSSTDIPITYFRKDGPNTTVPIMSDEFPDVMMRPQIVQRGNLKQLADENTGSGKKPKTISDQLSVKKVDPEVARKKMMAIADRASQESTKQQSFAKKVEVEKRKRRAERRGGAPGDVVPLGKRKQPEPDMPRSALRKAAPAQSNTRQRVYGPRTQVFDMSDPDRVN